MDESAPRPRRMIVHTRKCKLSIGPGIDFRRKCTCGAKWKPLPDPEPQPQEVACD